MSADVDLLQHYAGTRDAQAFAELARRHAGLVYGTCLRHVRNPHDAEDVAQQCFLELARKARQITGGHEQSIAGWLHATARTRSLDHLRSAARRRIHESEALAMRPDHTPPAWEQIAPIVDEALARLPKDLREPLLRQYFQGHTQAAIAADLNVDQSTVSRRIERAIEQLRQHLAKAGITASAVALTALLADNAATAAPPSMVAGLTKMALAGIAPEAIALSAGLAAKLAMLAAAVVLTIAGVVLRAQFRPATKPAIRVSATTQPPKEDPSMSTAIPIFRYGLRYNPTTWLESATSLDAARVRMFLLKKPKPADTALIQQEIDKALAKQKPDGSFGPSAKETGEPLANLLVNLGVSPEHPAVQRAVAALLKLPRHPEPDELKEPTDDLPIFARHALILVGRAKDPDVAKSIRWLAENPDHWIDHGCPWTPELIIKELWAAHADLPEVMPAIEAGLIWMRDNMNDAGCLHYFEPFGMLDAAGYVDHPIARDIVLKQVPMILRGQKADGSWGSSTFTVWRALLKYDLLESLRATPPLPPDWTITRSIPLPSGDWFTLAWDGTQFWTQNTRTNHAVAVDPGDGHIRQDLALPSGNPFGLAWWDGALAVTYAKAKRLVRIDPATEKIIADVTLDFAAGPTGTAIVNGKLWVCDDWITPGWVLDPNNPTDAKSRGRLEDLLAGPGPKYFAVMPDGVWHSDFWAPGLLKTGTGRKLLDWGEEPFGEASRGLAFDGTNLWCLDNAGKRLCAITRRVSGGG